MVLSLHWVFLQLLFEKKHQPLDWSLWPLEWPQLGCQGVLVGPVDGWLHYCTKHAVSPLAAHITGTLPSHLRMFSYYLHWRKWICLKTTNKQTKNVSPAEILPDDKRRAWLQRADGRWGKRCWQAVLTRPTSCQRWPRRDAPSGGSRPQQSGWKEVRQLFFSLNHWSRAA